MSQAHDYRYDVFISYNAADQDWVATVLLPRLEAAGLRVAVDYRDFVIGKPLVKNIEDIVTTSRRTIVVLSPEWVANEWNAFEALLIRTEDPAATRRKLLPLRLRPCELPAGLAKLKLDVADLTAERYKEAQLKRLVRDVEDATPVPLPAKVRDWSAWRRWLRRYRRWVRWAFPALILVWAVLFSILRWPPFHDRLVWLREPVDAPRANVLHNTGTVLLVGRENVETGCVQRHKGLWYRQLTAGSLWLESDVGDWLCIPDWNGEPALSDITALSSFPSDPQSIYALTSHSTLLVSTDGGAHFAPHLAGAPPVDPDDYPVGLILSGSQEKPVFWVMGLRRGLHVYRDGAWKRLDGAGAGACQGLPFDVTIHALLVDGERIVIGTDQRGLWVSDDGGRSCYLAFDRQGRYEFRELHMAAGGAAAGRYLALVHDWRVEPGRSATLWQLIDLCPRADACSPAGWQGEFTAPSFQTPVEDLLLQDDARGSYEWYLVTARGQVWRGTLAGDAPTRLPAITSCFFWCEAALAPDRAGAPPYLLAKDHVYRFAEGAWWRRLWP